MLVDLNSFSKNVDILQPILCHGCILWIHDKYRSIVRVNASSLRPCINERNCCIWSLEQPLPSLCSSTYSWQFKTSLWIGLNLDASSPSVFSHCLLHLHLQHLAFCCLFCVPGEVTGMEKALRFSQQSTLMWTPKAKNKNTFISN